MNKSLLKFVPVFYTICVSFLSCNGSKTPGVSSRSYEIMDTVASVKFWGNENVPEKDFNSIQDQVKQTLEQVDCLISTNNPSSDIYRMNSRNGTTFEMHSESACVLKTALETARSTNGALNPCLYPVIKEWGFTTGLYHVPSDEKIKSLLLLTDYTKVKFQGNEVSFPYGMTFDLGAVGKGYAGDRIMQVLIERGVKTAVIDLGGNVQTLGTKTDGSLWNIGIKNPRGNGIIGGLKTGAAAVITSGGYQRNFTADDGHTYIHIFDGRTGRPVENEMLSATAISSRGIYADCLSTAMFVMGVEKTIAFWQQHKDFDFILVSSDGTVYVSAGIAGAFYLNEDTGFSLQVVNAG